MPYIPRKDRNRPFPKTPGDLAFVIAREVDYYFAEHDFTFEHANAIVGVLENVKTEFQRRFLFPYEDMKREQNGDVFHITKLGHREALDAVRSDASE